jgi:hypothetical protein
MIQPPTTVSRCCDSCQYSISSRRQSETFSGPLRISFASFVSSSCMYSSCVSEPDNRLARRKIIYKRSRASDELLHTAGHARHSWPRIMLPVCCCFCCHDRARPRMQAIAGSSNHARRSAVSSWRGAEFRRRIRVQAGCERCPIHARLSAQQTPSSKTPACFRPPTAPRTRPCSSSVSARLDLNLDLTPTASQLCLR